MKKRIILCLAIILTALIVPGRVVRADSPPPNNGSCTVNEITVSPNSGDPGSGTPLLSVNDGDTVYFYVASHQYWNVGTNSYDHVDASGHPSDGSTNPYGTDGFASQLIGALVARTPLQSWQLIGVSEIWKPLVFAVTTGDHQVYLSMNDFTSSGGDDSGSLIVWYTVNCDPNTGTPPPPPAASKYQPCPSQNDNGVLPGTWKYDSPVAPDESGIGLDLNNAAIEKNFTLSRFHSYKIALSYGLTEAGPSESFSIGFGDFSAPLHTADTTDESLVVFPKISASPTFTSGGTDIYRVIIGEFTPADSPHLVINYFCITDLDATTGLGTGGGPTGNPNIVCKDCTYEATGDLIGDILGVLKWIWCGLSQLWDCTIKSLFYGIWKFVGVIITALAFLRQWVGLVFSNGSGWLGAVVPILWNFIRGLVGNIILTAFSALAGVFNALGITGIVNAILAFLANLPNAISQFMAFIPGVVSLLSTIWDFVTYWVTTVWNLVTGILGAIPVVFASVAQGFNQSASSIPVYAPTCNSSNTLFFGPCLGMYIIDNTVFDGPMYYVFPLVLGFVALNTILWSIEKFKEALSGD